MIETEQRKDRKKKGIEYERKLLRSPFRDGRRTEIRREWEEKRRKGKEEEREEGSEDGYDRTPSFFSLQKQSNCEVMGIVVRERRGRRQVKEGRGREEEGMMTPLSSQRGI